MVRLRCLIFGLLAAKPRSTSLKLKPDLVKKLASVLPDTLQKAVESAAEQSYVSNNSKATPFLNPLQLLSVTDVYSTVEGLKLLTVGGFADSLRKRVIFSKSDGAISGSSNYEDVLNAVRFQGQTLFESFNYKELLDYLINNVKLNPSDIGDIVFEGVNKAQIVCLPEVVSSLLAIKQVSAISVVVEKIQLSDLLNKKVNIKELSSVEASLRLDAVASAGFGMSRSKMVDLVDSGMISLNWKEVSKVYCIQEGSIISIAGYGRLEVVSVQETNKGRWKVKMIRYTS